MTRRRKGRQAARSPEAEQQASVGQSLEAEQQASFGQSLEAEQQASVGQSLEAEQQASFGHTLLSAARLYDALGQARLNAVLGGEVARPSVMRLIPYVNRAGIRPTELAQLADVTKQAVGQTLSRLEAQGLVEFAPDPSDGRALLVRMTAAGEAAAHEGLSALAAVERELSSRAGSDVVEAAFAALRRLLAELERMTTDAVPEGGP